MNRMIAWFAGNSVAANVLMILILAAGLLTAFTITLEVFPEISMDTITVTVEYPGAAPEEVEEAICARIEESVDGLEGIKKITSTANENVGMVRIQLEVGADLRDVLDDVKNRVDGITSFPAETEEPVIQELDNRQQVINIALYGDIEEKPLRQLGDRVRDDLAALDGITLVSLVNARPYEISIEVSEDDLRRHGLTMSRVADAVRRSSVDLPGGSVRTEGGEILLRTIGEAEVGREFEEIVLLTRPDGTQLRVGDVAEVRDGFAETDQSSLFDERPAVILEVFRTGDQNALEVADKVNRYIEESVAWLPPGMRMAPWNDNSIILQQRLNLLLSNGLLGFILVFIVLALFLRFRLAFWVSLGIPISFLGALWMLPMLDVTINMLSMFAFIVVLGIVVDDAIIVGENIYTHQQRGGGGLRGAISGAQEVSKPVIFAILTTIAAFAPLMAIDGTMGKFMRVVPLVVIPCLVFSLIESLLILPAHLSHRKEVADADRTAFSRAWRRFQGRFADGLTTAVRRFYAPGLEVAIRWRYVTVAIGIATLSLTMGLWAGKYVGFVFFPDVPADFLTAGITMPLGTPVESTAEAAERIERSAARLRQEVLDETGEDVVVHTLTAIGSQPTAEQQARNGGQFGTTVSAGHVAEVTIELTPSEGRAIDSDYLVDRWRELTGAIPDAEEVVFGASIFSAGEPINVQLAGPDIQQLEAAAEELKLKLAEYDGVYEIADSFLEGKRELKLGIRPQAELVGLSMSDLGRQVRQAFYGEEAQRIQRGRDELKVMVRYPEEQRRSLDDVESMRIRTATGLEVPFSEVADVEAGRGYATITRVDRRRAINVTADVDESQTNASDVLADLGEEFLPQLTDRYIGMTFSFEGQNAEQRDTMAGLGLGLILASIGIYALLAIPLRSYIQPALIMAAIPFGLVGAVWGHVIMGMDLTILSMFGIVALAGVVVNDSLVMVDFINRYREEHGSLHDAVREAGVARFRPILLTSLTTFVGLSPLMFEESMQARFLIPMAVSLAYGVLFSTFITLILIPCGYTVLEDLRALFTRGTRPATEPGEEMPAIASGS